MYSRHQVTDNYMSDCHYEQLYVTARNLYHDLKNLSQGSMPPDPLSKFSHLHHSQCPSQFSHAGDATYLVSSIWSMCQLCDFQGGGTVEQHRTLLWSFSFFQTDKISTKSDLIRENKNKIRSEEKITKSDLNVWNFSLNLIWIRLDQIQIRFTHL